MTPEEVASAIRVCRGAANDNTARPSALLALADIATEYLAATDAWDATSYDHAELLGASARLERADRQLRTALGLPDGNAPTEFGLPTCAAPPDLQTTFAFEDRVAPTDLPSR